MLGLAIVSVFVLLSVFRISIFETIEIKLYDMAMQFTASDKGDTSRIVLVDIDDKSLLELGSWPWPRKRIADLLNILKKDDVALVGIHLPLTDREPAQGLRELKSFREKFTAYASVKNNTVMTEWILENLKQMENGLDNDGLLRSSIQNIGNVILSGKTSGTFEISISPSDNRNPHSPDKSMVSFPYPVFPMATIENIVKTTNARQVILALSLII